MRFSSATVIGLTFATAAGAAFLAATGSVKLIETVSERSIRTHLDDHMLEWAKVHADGLQVILSGTAPDEAERFRAISATGEIVDAARVLDEMEVAAIADLTPPQFSVEILRNLAGISVIGLIPKSTDRSALRAQFDAPDDVPVTDLLETADFDAPEGWVEALEFAIDAISEMPRAKISARPGSVSISAMTESPEEKRTLESRLTRMAPRELTLDIDISAPRPVIAPFALRFVIDQAGARFDACSADNDATVTRILTAAEAAGLPGVGVCTIGMGVPSPSWGEAVALSIGALGELGQGTLSFSNADITLVAAQGTNPTTFDKVIGELETTLPPVFALNAVLTPVPEAVPETPEFYATLSPEGLVQLRGRLGDTQMREVADSFAKAQFGSDNVYTATRIVEGLPEDWSLRVLTGLRALGTLSNGVVNVTPNQVALSGSTGDPDASAEVSNLFSELLGAEADVQINITYRKEDDPVASAPTPKECEAKIADIVAVGKINFEPGSATIDAATLGVMDAIAEVLKECGDLKLEIQGHTDSQGREEMNLALSQARAESVLNELRARRVLTRTFTANGYGESQPIADNKTEEGREANRRIEFHLIEPEPSVPEGESVLESLADSGDTDTQDGKPEGNGDE